MHEPVQEPGILTVSRRKPRVPPARLLGISLADIGHHVAEQFDRVRGLRLIEVRQGGGVFSHRLAVEIGVDDRVPAAAPGATREGMEPQNLIGVFQV